MFPRCPSQSTGRGLSPFVEGVFGAPDLLPETQRAAAELRFEAQSSSIFFQSPTRPSGRLRRPRLGQTWPKKPLKDLGEFSRFFFVLQLSIPQGSPQSPVYDDGRPTFIGL